MAYQKLTPIIATGSTAPRYLGDRFSDVVNLKDFGAVGDGETDDSTAWAAWQTALASGGMPYIPKGNYLLGEEIVHAPKGHFGRSANSFTYEDDGPVLDEFSATVYVDATNGSDSNDGISQGTAVETINKALELVDHRAGTQKICISSGAYSEYVEINNKQVIFDLLGNVAISDGLHVTNTGSLHVLAEDSSYVLTVSGTSSREKVLLCDACSYIHASCKINVATTAQAGVAIESSSHGDFYSLLTISGTPTIGLYVYISSCCVLHGGIHVNDTCSSNGIEANSQSCIIIKSSHVVKAAGGGVFAFDGSLILVRVESTAEDSSVVSSSTAYFSRYESIIDINLKSNTKINLTVNGYAFFYSNTNSLCNVEGPGTITFSGNVSSGTATATVNSVTNVYTDLTLSGSVTGKRYNVNFMSGVSVSGAGANRFPGSSNGNINSNAYCYYG